MKILCIDIGGSYLKHTVVEDDKIIFDVQRTPTPRDSLDSFLKVMEAIFRSYHDLEGIAISTPGIVDVEKGYMYTGGSLDYIRNVEMKDILSKICDNLPVNIENDGKAAATAELKAGVLQDVEDAVIMTLGTAIGGTVVIRRKILRGKDLFAGEFSYAIYRDTGKRGKDFDLMESNMGYRGTPSQIVRLYGEEGLTCEDILMRFQKGDQRAGWAMRKAASEAALLIHNLQCILDTEVFAIGGGISERTEYIDMIREESKKINDIYEGVVPLPKIVSCRFHNDANLLGAYYAFKEAYLGDA